MPFLLDNISFSFTATPLLSRVSLRCSPGQRLAVVGPNGCGKTTLLRLAAGDLEPQAGSVTQPSRARCLFKLPESDASVANYLDQQSGSISAKLKRFEELSGQLADNPGAKIPEEYSLLLEEITALNAWDYESTKRELLGQFGLADLDTSCPMRTLSPGTLARLALTGILNDHDAALVLDEPTNHLDAVSRETLIETLVKWPAEVLFVSHDRDFIEQVATSVIDLDSAVWQGLALARGENQQGVWETRGGYSDYLREKERARQSYQRIYESQQEEKRKLSAHREASEVVGHIKFKPRTEIGAAQNFFADRATKVSTRRKNDDRTRLEQLSRREVMKPRFAHFGIEIPPVHLGAGIALSVREASVPGRLAVVNLELASGEKLLVTGPNGSGKTTLLDWIAAGAPPTDDASGLVNCNCKTVLIGQDLPERTDTAIPANCWEKGVGVAGKGILHPKFWNIPLGKLSAGNLRRAQFALALSRIASQNAALIVDEPTNYLDLDFVQVLENALTSWNGTLILASHDTWLINHWPFARLMLQ